MLGELGDWLPNIDLVTERGPIEKRNLRTAAIDGAALTLENFERGSYLHVTHMFVLPTTPNSLQCALFSRSEAAARFRHRYRTANRPRAV
jgi:hypothetical protein